MVTPQSLRQVWLFESLSERELDLVMSVLEYRLCPGESHVVEANTADRSLYVILSGSVRIVTHDADGNESPIAEVLPGQHFGEVCFVDGGLRTATAVTNEASELLVVDPRRFARLAEEEPAAAYKILWSMLRLLCGRLRNTDHWLFELMSR